MLNIRIIVERTWSQVSIFHVLISGEIQRQNILSMNIQILHDTHQQCTTHPGEEH